MGLIKPLELKFPNLTAVVTPINSPAVLYAPPPELPDEIVEDNENQAFSDMFDSASNPETKPWLTSILPSES